MPKFVFAYHGSPKSMSQDEGRAHMKNWMAWMNSLGEAVIDRGLPVGKSHTVGRDGITENGGSNPLEGFTVIEAADMKAALEMAARSPHVEIGGTIEVAPALNMPM
jgi:hypothetical protein